MNGKHIFLALALAPALHAGDVPRGSFPGAEYEAAKASAKEKGKPIAVVVTDTASSCPKCQSGNEEVFKKMRSDYVLVVADKARKDKLPGAIEQKTFEIYRSKGNIIPIVSVFSPDDDKLLGGLCYKQISADSRKAFKNLEAEVEKAKSQTAAPAPTERKDTTAEACDEGGMCEWTNVLGKTIKAEALAVTDTSVTFKLENGKVIDYPLDKLSEESREAAKDAVR